MKLGISGACGQIGRQTVLAALKQGHEITIFDLPIEINKKIHAKHFPQTKAIWGDICNYEDCIPAIKDIENFIHLCAIIPFSSHTKQNAETNKELAYNVNVNGTKNIVQAMEEFNPNARLVFASSGAVYGINDTIRKVGNPLNPADDEYAQQKIMAEDIVTHSKLNWTILRICCGVISKEHNLKPNPQMFSYRALDTKVEFGHIDDISLAFVNSLNVPECYHKILNLGGGKHMQTTHGEQVRILCEKYDIPMPPNSAFPAKGQGAWADTDDSERLFHYQQHTLKDIF